MEYPAETHLYQVDAVGNRTGEKRAATGVVAALTVAAFAALSPTVASATVERQHNAVDWVVAVNDVKTSTTTGLTYDANGNRTGEGTKAYRWDIRDTLTRVEDGSTVVGRYDYDAKLQRVKAETAQGPVDCVLGRPTAIRTGIGTADVQETTRVYGLRGELREVRQPGGGVWAYGYDDLLRLTSITPPANSSRPVETFEWNDGLGRMTRHFAGQTWTYTYGSGETTETTPNGELRKTLVDGRGRAAAVQYTVTAANGPGITGKTLRWDGWDALVGIDETRSSVPVQTQTFTYDTSHRLTGVVRGLASVSYGYSNATRQPSSKNGLTYGYDALGRLSSVTAPWGVTSVTWEAGGQRLKTLGAETFEYYGQGWLKSVTTPQGVRTYAYDGRGNRLTETMTGSTVAVRRFSYDSADRLVATQEWDGHIEAWALHGDGAKQQEKQWPPGTPFSRPFDFATANPATTKNYTYRTDGTLQSVTDAISNFVEIGYTHDNNGQVTQRTVGGVSTTYGWDVDGRLVTANSSGPGLPTLALGGHFKSGHWRSVQNRPTSLRQDWFTPSLRSLRLQSASDSPSFASSSVHT